MSFQLKFRSFVSGSKIIQEKYQRFLFFPNLMICCNRIVCGCWLWDDLDWKEFCVGSLKFMKGRVLFEFIVQLLFINSLKSLKI